MRALASLLNLSMEKKNWVIVTLSLVFGVVGAAVWTVGIPKIQEKVVAVQELRLGGSDLRTERASTTVWTVGYLTAVQVVPTSTSRFWLKIQNKGATRVYMNYNGRVATVAAGDPLNPATSTEPLVFDLDNLYTGAISMITDGTNTTTVSVTEFYND